MAKLKALVTAEVVKDVLEQSFHEEIEFVYDGYCLNHNVMPHTELAEKIKDVEILICEYDTISSDIFDVAKSIDALLLLVVGYAGILSMLCSLVCIVLEKTFEQSDLNEKKKKGFSLYYMGLIIGALFFLASCVGACI